MSHCGVVIPVYAATPERLEYFSLCLQSLARQNAPFVGVVVDDDSPKNQDVKRIIETLGDGRIRYFFRKKELFDAPSSSAPINYGIELLRSKEALRKGEKFTSFCYLHSDDMLPENSLDMRLELLQNNPVVHGDILVINGRNEPRKRKYTSPDTPSTIFTWTMMWRREALDAVIEHAQATYQHPLFCPELASCEDTDAKFSTREVYRNIPGVQQICYYYREEGAVRISTSVELEEQRRVSLEVKAKHGIIKSDTHKFLRDALAKLKRKTKPLRNKIEAPFRRHEFAHIKDPLLNLH